MNMFFFIREIDIWVNSIDIRAYVAFCVVGYCYCLVCYAAKCIHLSRLKNVTSLNCVYLCKKKVLKHSVASLLFIDYYKCDLESAWRIVWARAGRETFLYVRFIRFFNRIRYLIVLFFLSIRFAFNPLAITKRKHDVFETRIKRMFLETFEYLSQISKREREKRAGELKKK